MPPKRSNSYADEGTLLHDVLEQVLRLDIPPDALLGKTYQTATLTEELIDQKVLPALALFDELALDEFDVELTVSFGDVLPGVFGSADVIGRRGKTAVVCDWKMGDGVMVDAEENEQGLFYAAAAMHTPECRWAFEGADEVEIVIIQPPQIRRWKTSVARVLQFEQDLITAVKESGRDDARLSAGDHCRWCAAKAICPVLTGEFDRATRTKLKDLDAAAIAAQLDKLDILKEYVKGLEELALTLLENSVPVGGYKIVKTRPTRKWANEKNVVAELLGMGLTTSEVFDTKVISPAQAEKKLKSKDIKLPAEMVTAVSSGVTIAPESDPRPAVLQIGKQLTAALKKL
jgi:hypothetical protein